jgi:hypothetical protein
MTKGWQLIASINYNIVIGEGNIGGVTRFLMGKDPKHATIRGPLPHLFFPQQEPTGDPKDVIEEEPSVDEETDEEIEGDEWEEDEEKDEDEIEEEVDDVKKDMDELLGDGPKSA